MKHSAHISILFCLCLLMAGKLRAGCDDIYIVVYITQDGVTGHVGIAVENYDILVRDVRKGDKTVSLEDTVSNGTLTFFDLWPQKDLHIGHFNKNTAPQYFRLPRSSSEEKITVESILNKGLPHRYRLPCDGMLRIASTPAQDFQLKTFIEALPQKKPNYNSRRYNCADFVLLCLRRHFGVSIRAKEFIPLSWVSTPNRLYRQCSRALPVTVIRDPGPKVKRSFFRERVLKKYFSNKNSDNENR